jgi:hydroxyacyl-ACP dehydratase HTD2-like protein with hotdog domain
MEIGSIPDEARALIGRKRTRSHYVTEQEIIRFAQASGNNITRLEGGIQAPLLFTQALSYEAVPLEQLPADGSPRELDVPLPAARTVGGSSEYEVFRRVRAGETIDISSSVKNVYSKQGRTGVLYFVEVETHFSDAKGEPVAHELATFIKKV